LWLLKEDIAAKNIRYIFVTRFLDLRILFNEKAVEGERKMTNLSYFLGCTTFS
jgi:hypothetical protein